MHAKFMYSATNAFGITKVTEANGVKAGQDAGLGLLIPEITETVGKDLCLPDLIHVRIVSKWIRSVNR